MRRPLSTRRGEGDSQKTDVRSLDTNSRLSVDDLSDAPSILLAVEDPGMRGAGCVDRDRVLILCEENSVLTQNVGGLRFVGRFEKTGLRRGRHVDAAASEAVGQRSRAVLIQVEADCRRHEPHSIAGPSRGSKIVALGSPGRVVDENDRIWIRKGCHAARLNFYELAKSHVQFVCYSPR
jgi:hypothetical protein